MLKLVTSPIAKNDLKKIWRYSHKIWGEKQADKYLNELEQAFISILNNSEIGVDIDHVLVGYRLYHFKHHLIIYHLRSSIIDIVRVLNENMDVKGNLTKKEEKG